VDRFEIAFPDEALTDLRDRLARSRWPETPTAESWDEGTAVPAMRELAQAWEEDDWRAHESAMNAYDHHRTDVDGQPVHFLRVARQGELPLLLLHGWPSTHWDFARLVPHLDGFELVIPDLPGFGFSPLARAGIGYLETAELMHALMTDGLGHDRYAVYGFDWGALVAEQLAHAHEDAVVALHVSMPFPLDFVQPAPGALDARRAGVRRADGALGAGGLRLLPAPGDPATDPRLSDRLAGGARRLDLREGPRLER
jgi:pimeloyl-ACP methyl ester carboxylesterase